MHMMHVSYVQQTLSLCMVHGLEHLSRRHVQSLKACYTYAHRHMAIALILHAFSVLCCYNQDDLHIYMHIHAPYRVYFQCQGS